MRSSVRWDVELIALSSISQKGEDSGTTTTPFRREPVIQPDGTVALVPTVSGNSLRGALRRIAEELFREQFCYEGQISLSAAHALRNGGSLTKVSGDGLTGRRRQQLRELVPPIAVFGGNGGGQPPIDGCLKVGKVVPRIRETESIVTRPFPGPLLSCFEIFSLESYSRFDDTVTREFPEPIAVPDEKKAQSMDSMLMRFEVETLPAGTHFETFLRMDRATPIEVSFFGDVWERFARDGSLGGRSSIGHGRVRVESQRVVLAGREPEPVDWRAELGPRRDDVITALGWLT
ncbi:RAMP superfamily CRISPR-associated protein [Antrihabitans spumae]|uniref:RAMP superfamily CRISPR-associated protein n=1 Tax=Antrihabitans spumae TaxID=3373370 RepID=A0ABW7JVZ3_9NOCA